MGSHHIRSEKSSVGALSCQRAAIGQKRTLKVTSKFLVFRSGGWPVSGKQLELCIASARPVAAFRLFALADRLLLESWSWDATKVKEEEEIIRRRWRAPKVVIQSLPHSCCDASRTSTA